MAADALKSLAITNLDATPIVANETGAGAKASSFQVDGWCAVTAVGIATATSTYRLCRFPTWAKIKTVEIWTDVAIDSGSSQALALDLNVVFSDSKTDGTPALLQGLIPTTVGNPTTPTAATTTTFASYASPNIIFGTKTLSGNNAAIPITNITLSGTARYTADKFMQMPLWRTFGFQDGRGMLNDPGGFFDLVAYVSVAANTGAAGNLYGKVSYTN